MANLGPEICHPIEKSDTHLPYQMSTIYFMGDMKYALFSIIIIVELYKNEK